MIINTDPGFVDTIGVPAPTDPVTRDRQIETACYGEPETPEGSGIGFVLSIWIAFGAGALIGSLVTAARLSQ